MMSARDRQDFLTWYDEKRERDEIFDFAKEILEYCRSDVDILRQACLKFREILMNITGKEEVVFDEELPEKKTGGRGGSFPTHHHCRGLHASVQE